MAYDTPYTPKDNTGTLFKNDRKEKETHPDYKGSILITEPGEYWLSSWIKEGPKGKYMSLSATIKEQPASVPQSGYKKPSQDAFKARQLPPQRPQNDDDLPPF